MQLVLSKYALRPTIRLRNESYGCCAARSCMYTGSVAAGTPEIRAAASLLSLPGRGKLNRVLGVPCRWAPPARPSRLRLEGPPVTAACTRTDAAKAKAAAAATQAAEAAPFYCSSGDPWPLAGLLRVARPQHAVKVRFTDIDYKVYTDAAQRVLEGGSPYERHTYRYSPLVAYLCLPNLLGLPFFGKVVFCFMDIAVAWLIEKGLRGMHRARVQQQHQQQQQGAAAVAEMQQSASSPFTSNREQALPSSSSTDSSSSSKEGDDEYPLHTFVLPCCCWLYNPIVATVSVRGNADALPCLLVLLTVSALRWRAVFLAAILYGLSVHVKLYPVIYGIPMLLFLQQGGAADSVVALPERPGGLLQQAVWALLWVPFAAALLPVRVCVFLLRRMGARQWLFGVASVSVFCLLGCAFYRLYGFPFLFESYLYHATRRDHRHNFSVFFYLLYLDSEAPLKGLSLGLLVPQLVGTLLLGCYFARTHLEAALCLQTMVFVALNKVCTSQYFLWWLCLLPFAVASTDMQPRTLKQTTAALVVFQLANLVWLLFGYQLEFEGKPVYLQLMFSSVLFVATQVGLVGFLSSKIRANDKTAAPSDTSRTKKD